MLGQPSLQKRLAHFQENETRTVAGVQHWPRLGLAGQKGWGCHPNPNSYGSQALSNKQFPVRVQGPFLCLQECLLTLSDPNLETTTLDIRRSVCSQNMICGTPMFPAQGTPTPHPLGWPWPCLAP